MKKILILVLALVMVFCLCACGKSIDTVTLSTNNCEIVQDESFELSYSVVPEDADTEGLIWASADENVASVNESGVITGKAVGQTSVTISDGKKVFATCQVTVLEKPAYDQLNDKEREFVDAFLAHIDFFLKPESVEVTGIQFVPGDDIEDFWNVEIKGETALGTTTSDLYFLNKTYGFSESIFSNSTFTFSDSDYKLDLVNKAIAEKR
jgi:hypothetical protein